MAKPLSWTRPSKRSWKSILSPISPYLSSSQGSERAWPSVNFSLSSFCISSSLKVTPGTKCGLLSCPVVTTGLRLQPWTNLKKNRRFQARLISLWRLTGHCTCWPVMILGDMHSISCSWFFPQTGVLVIVEWLPPIVMPFLGSTGFEDLGLKGGNDGKCWSRRLLRSECTWLVLVRLWHVST